MHAQGQAPPGHAGQWLRLLVIACLLVRHVTAPAQTAVAEGSTIRVYANLLQIPVLILGNKHQSLPPISPAAFSVQLGKDAPFRPNLVRLQGEDPITLAILLDGSTRDALLPLAADALTAMAGEHLHAQDRVSVYAMDGCKLRRFYTLGAASSGAVRDSVQRAAAIAPYEPYAQTAQPCPKPVGLWDATDYLARTLAKEPGRRVVLAVTNGKDPGGQLTADAARRDANLDGVTIFAVAERYKVPLLGPVFPRTAAGWQMTSFLEGLTEGSGGMTVETTRNNLPYAFKRFVELLRGRYIVEFQRPRSMVAGTSVIAVACGVPKAFIRPAGTSLPVADPLVRDPAVQHGSSTDITDQAEPIANPLRSRRLPRWLPR